MPGIDPISGRPAILPADRVPGGASGFRVPDAPGPAAALPGVSEVAPLLVAQELDDPLLRDRAARRQAHAVLDSLAELQARLLDGGDDGTTTARLAALARMPSPADPALAGVTRAIAVRAAVELARRSPEK